MSESNYNLEACQECDRLCLALVSHCQTKDRQQAGMKQIRLLLDCAEICRTAVGFLPHGSALHLTICNACAVVCLKCAAACEEFASDELMQGCAAACRCSAEACHALVASFTEKQPVYRSGASAAMTNTMAN